MSKRPGRPPIDPDDLSVRVTFTLPAKRYDAMYRTAAAERQTVPEFIRETLTRVLTQQKLSRPRS